MKKYTLIICCILSIAFVNPSFSQTGGSGTSSASATFEKVWIDYNIKEDGIIGMRIHLKFKTYSMKGMDAYAAIYFEKENGDVLKDKNAKFNSTAGEVAAYKSIKPNYDPAMYDDLQIFMPYSELDLTPGKYKLPMDIKVIYKEGGLISKLSKYDFEYTKPGNTDVSSDKADAIFEDLWIDYDVTQDGKKGMKIHLKFKVRNIYDDVQLFVPYSEFVLGKGRFDMKMSADVIYKNGDMVKHLKDKEFWVEF